MIVTSGWVILFILPDCRLSVYQKVVKKRLRSGWISCRTTNGVQFLIPIQSRFWYDEARQDKTSGSITAGKDRNSGREAAILKFDQNTPVIEEVDLHLRHKLLVLALFPVAFLFYGIVASLFEYESISRFLEGTVDILLSPTLLVTDFLAVGGVGAAFVQAGLIGIAVLVVFRAYRLRINGLLIAGFFTTFGFALFGKNLLNTAPILLGGILYARYQKIPFKNLFVVLLFSTALSPLVSELTFTGIFPRGTALLAGLSIGVGIGFIIVPLSAHMLRFHDGYNLYNIGFTAGIAGTVVTSLLRSMTLTIEPVSILHPHNDPAVWVMVAALSATVAVIGLCVRKRALRCYPALLRHPGRTVTDFTVLEGYGSTYFNMGVMGLTSIGIVLLLGGVPNGPVLAGIFTVIGFSAFGKHPRNCLPVMAGVLLAGWLFGADLSSTVFIIAVLFSTTIAPIAGVFGMPVGVLAGMLHYVLVTNIGIVHGGVNLYNNGFAGGLAAGFLVPILDAFRRKKEKMS